MDTEIPGCGERKNVSRTTIEDIKPTVRDIAPQAWEKLDFTVDDPSLHDVVLLGRTEPELRRAVMGLNYDRAWPVGVPGDDAVVKWVSSASRRRLNQRGVRENEKDVREHEVHDHACAPTISWYTDVTHILVVQSQDTLWR